MLTVSISSFSFIYGPKPVDESKNGGGFVFDCRALPNPGKFEMYKPFSGKDKIVRQFLDEDKEVQLFMELVYQLIAQSVKKYVERDFTNLMVSFGCTGGQHRSVYAAEKLANYLKSNFDINLKINHLREGVWG